VREFLYGPAAARERPVMEQEMRLLILYCRVFGLLAAEKRLVVLLIISSMAIAVTQFAEPVLFGRIVDRLIGAPEGARSQVWPQIAPLALLWIGFGLFNILASALVALKADQLSHRRRLAVMSGFFEHLLQMPVLYHKSVHTGRQLKIMLDGAAGIASIWLSFLRDNCASLIMLLVLLPVTLALNWRLALLLIVLLVSSGWVIAFVMKRTEVRQREVERYHTGFAERASDTLGNIAVVQSFTRVRTEANGLRGMADALLQAQMPVLTWWAAATVTTRASGAVTVLSILLFGSWLFMRDLATIGEIVMFIALATMFIGKLEQLIAFFNWTFMQAPKLEEFFNVMDTQTTVKERADAIDPGRLSGRIVFDSVSHTYDETRPAIESLSFRVAAGERVALVGETGSGKSTAMAILYRAFDPVDGRVLIDDIDIADMKLEALRSNVGIVFQEPLLFARTIEDNLRVGKPEASEDELWRALEGAQAADFIRKLPDGLRTHIGERGARLSGGERQRLAIARALLKNPPILILDEATSALDAVTEKSVQSAIDAAMSGRTTFIIAHRLSTIRRADQIVVLKQGRMVENGTYRSLMQKEGVFAQLVAADNFAA